MDSEFSGFMTSNAVKGAAHPRSLATSFMKGMGHRLSDHINELKANRTANVRAKGKDIVVVKGNLVDAAYAEQLRSLNFKKPKPLKPAKNQFAYFAGMEAGDRVNLSNKEIEDRRPYWAWNWKAPRTESPQSNFNASKPGRKSLLHVWVRQAGLTIRAILKMAALLRRLSDIDTCETKLAA